MTTIDYQDFFKRLLIHLYDLTQINIKNMIFNPLTSNISSKKGSCDQLARVEEEDDLYVKLNHVIHNFRYLEIINYLTFLTKIIKPPPFTDLRLNFHNCSVNLYFDSLFDLSNKDSSLQILLDCLELTIIIKLWVSLLCEKNVILIGNRSLLYPSCSALLTLLFPFKWMHTYIPLFPDTYELEILDAPVPYLIGLPKERRDYKLLCEQYPNHVICDLSTSQLSKGNYIDLPEQEENKLRTKVKYLRYPKLDKIDDMLEEPEEGNVKDVKFENSFPQNIQRIFFRIFRDNLKNFEQYMNNKHKFNQLLFLEDLHNNEDRQFWEEIINSQAFEEFILGHKYWDCPNTLRFKNIENMNEEDENKWQYDNSFSLSFNIPDKINYIFSAFPEKNKKQIKILFDDYNIIFKEIKSNFSNYFNKHESESFSCKTDKDISNNTTPYYIISSIDKSDRNSTLNAISYSNPFKIYDQEEKLDFTFNNTLHKYLQDRKIEIKSDSTNFEVYGETGFHTFYNNLFSESSELDQISVSSILKNQLYDLKNENTDIIKFKFSNKLKEIEESKHKDEIEEERFATHDHKDNIIFFDNKKNAQYYSSLAFLFQEYIPYSVERNEFIFNLYLKSCFLDNENFSKQVFYMFIKSLSIEELKELEDSQSLDTIVKIIHFTLREKLKRIKEDNKKLEKQIQRRLSNSANKESKLIKDAIAKDISKNSSKKEIHKLELFELAKLREGTFLDEKELFDRNIKSNYKHAMKIKESELKKNKTNMNFVQQKTILINNNSMKGEWNFERKKTMKDDKGEFESIVSSYHILNKLDLIKQTNREPYIVAKEFAYKIKEVVKYFNFAIFKSKINKTKIKEIMTQHESKLHEIDKLANEIGVSI